MASDDSDATSSSGSSDSEGGAPTTPTGETDIDEVPAKIPADEVILKRRRLSNAASERSVADEPAQPTTKKENKSKKAKKVKEQEPEPAIVEEKVASKAEEADEEQEKDTKKKGKKAEKKRKQASDVAEAEEPSVKKVKKGKKNKDTEETAEGEQWHVEELDGGSARQQKFLRLLGGKRAGAASDIPTTSHAKGKSDVVKAEAEIQRQFEEGMKMKAEGGSKRRGLGA